MSFLQRFAQHLGLALAGMFVMVGRPSGFALAIEMSEGAQVITVAVQNELITPQVMYHDLRSLPKAKKDKPGDPRVEKPGRVTPTSCGGTGRRTACRPGPSFGTAKRSSDWDSGRGPHAQLWRDSP